MNDDQRLRIAVPYLLMVIAGAAVWLFTAIGMARAAQTSGLLWAVVGAWGFVRLCWGHGALGKALRHLKRDRALERATGGNTGKREPPRHIVLPFRGSWEELRELLDEAEEEGFVIRGNNHLEKPSEL